MPTPFEPHRPRMPSPQPFGLPPSLNDLNVKQNAIPNLNYANTQNDKSENDKKRELLFKFELLKKSYKDVTIPDFSLHSDYSSMKSSYEMTIRRVSIETSVETYKKFLIGGFMVTEYVFGSVAGFDMQGFTQQQITSLSSYERLLIELGEKSYVDEESQWPVEFRLLGLIMMNAATFLGTKVMMKKGGAGFMNVLNQMNTHTQNTQERPKRKMRGPNIDFDDLPDLTGTV